MNLDGFHAIHARLTEAARGLPRPDPTTRRSHAAAPTTPRRTGDPARTEGEGDGRQAAEPDLDDPSGASKAPWALGEWSNITIWLN